MLEDSGFFKCLMSSYGNFLRRPAGAPGSLSLATTYPTSRVVKVAAVVAIEDEVDVVVATEPRGLLVGIP